MPAGSLKALEQLMDSVNDTIDSYIVLSIHNDIDILVSKKDKAGVIKVLERLDFVPQDLGEQLNLKCLYGAELVRQYRDPHGCAVDLHTGLNYRGIEPSFFVPINNEFQKYVQDTKVKTNDFWRYRLSPESEVVHTVCRIIFDKRRVPAHYEDRLERNLDKCDKDELKYAFNLALFKAGFHIFELVTNSRFNNLFQEYIQFSDY